MNYKSYQKSRDAAWEILIRHRVSELPVDIVSICKEEQIRLLSYERAFSVIDDQELLENTYGNDAFTWRNVIFYNQECSIGRRRFSIAHEIGHIILHDTSGMTVYNREPEPGDDPIETEANLFAARLLAPAIVLHGIGAFQPEEIACRCQISVQAARFRAERLQILEERNERFLRERGYPCFGLSKLERQVETQFRAYIEKNRI